MRQTIKILNNKENFYGLLSPYDCEDLLYFYLYNKNKYVVIPSTNKTSTQNYEFEMINLHNHKVKVVHRNFLYCLVFLLSIS